MTEGGTETNVGTDSSSYTLTSADQGHHMKVKVTFTDDGGTEENRTSEQTFLVMPAAVSSCSPGSDPWCATLTAGHSVAQPDQSPDVGFRASPSYGSVSPAMFSHGGVQYTVTTLIGAATQDIYFETSPNLPADGAGLTLHLQRYSGELDLALADGTFNSRTNQWDFVAVTGTTASDPLSDAPLLRKYTRGARAPGETDVGMQVAVRLSAPPNTAATGQPSITGFPRVGGTVRARLGTIADTGGLPETFPDDYDLQWVRVDADGVSNPQDIAGATSGTYTAVAADVGKKLKVKVSFTDAEGVAEGPLESEATSAAVREASAPLLDTTLTVGGSGKDRGRHAPTTSYPCADRMGQHTFVSTDGGGVEKEFTIRGLQVSDLGGDVGKILNIWFEGTRELRDYEVNNLVLVLDGTRFLFRNADAGGYHLRQWQNTSLNWSRGQTVEVQILDAPGAREQQVLQPLTASFENLPAEHDGSSPFTFRLVSVGYVTANGSAMAGSDYTATSGTLSFAAGETEKTVPVPVIDDLHDEGDETLTLTLSNASGAWIEDGEATGTIENHDPLPAAFIARFGRATAEQVVQHVEARMAAPRERGFRARFAGREFRPGMERDFALGFLSGFGPPMGTSEMGGYPGGASAVGGAPMGGSTMDAHVSGHGVGAPGMAGRLRSAGAGAAAMPRHEPSAGPGGGFLGSFLPGGDLFSNSEFELNREQHGGVVSVWSRSSRSHFGGAEGALSLGGDGRTTMFGADYTRGALVVGLSVGRTLGLGGYSGPSAGQMTSSMTGFYPWLGYQVNDRVSVWGVTGYGTGALSLAPDGAAALETGLSMAMTAAGTRGELIGSRATGGFALAFKADALWVGAATGEVDGAAGRLSASEAGVTRVRTALEGSRGFTVGGRVSLTPSVEIGLRQDGGDAETGAGMDVGSGLVLTDAVTGLSLDVRVRTLVLHQAAGFTERGMSFSFGWDPTPSSPLGLTARLSPSWGGSAMSGAEALWHGQMAYGPGSHRLAGTGGQLDAKVGYGLPAGRFVGTPRAGFRTSVRSRA